MAMGPSLSRPLALVFLGLSALSGCAEELEPPRYAVLAPVERTSSTIEVRHVVPPPAPPVDDELVSRPRLSRTLRLGQETVAYDTGVRAAPPQGAPSGVTVVVNNNISQQQAVVVGGGYGGYGGGGYGAPRDYGSFARPSYGRAPSISAPPQPQAPNVSSPPIGGNWAPPVNYGPPAMR